MARLLLMFNSGGYVERALDRGYRCCVKDQFPSVVNNEPVTSALIGWLDDAGSLQFSAHAYVRADGSIAANGLLDPKVILGDDGRYYRL